MQRGNITHNPDSQTEKKVELGESLVAATKKTKVNKHSTGQVAF